MRQLLLVTKEFVLFGMIEGREGRGGGEGWMEREEVTR